MKNNFFTSLLIWIGLTLASMPGLAKTTPQTAKKQVSSSAKSVKTNVHNVVTSKKQERPASKKASSNAAIKQKSIQTKPHQLAKDSKHDKLKLAETKDSKHGKSKADAKGSKHDKSKSHQLADKDTKHGKSKSHLADKDSKHGKSKLHQLADAKDSKHSRKKSHQVVEESVEEDNEEDTSTVAESDEPAQVADESNRVEPASQLDTSVSEASAAPPKSSTLFFQPLDKNNAAPTLVENSTKPDDIPSVQTVDSHPEQKNSAPATLSFSMDNNATKSSVVASNNEEENPLPPSAPVERDDALIPPSHNNKRVHSSIGGHNNNFIDNATDRETSRHVASTYGIVDTSLASAGEKAGLSNDMIIELTDIFAWDIDFANRLQAGDQFTVVYEQTGTGKANNQIVAAQFINRGKTYTAIRYKDNEGIVSYYTPEGRSLRKAFLSTPVDFARVSSPFSTHRKHPILNRIRAHKGVDYAARTGTPVKAAGDGVITFHGNKGAYGRMIVISHGEHYETAYAHLSNFRKDLQDGEPVKQGEVIGFVGQSGLATGPHLHYEFRVDGVHRDPENLDSKQAMRLPHEEWENFHAQTIPVLTRLNQAKSSTLVAKNP